MRNRAQRFKNNTADGSRWIFSGPTYLEHHSTLLRAGEFSLSGGFNVRSPARKLSLALSL